MCGAEGPLWSLLDIVAMYTLLCDELSLTEEEKVYFGPSSLAVMLAKLCRNCTHIRPMSCFHHYMSATRGDRALEADHESLAVLQELAAEIVDAEKSKETASGATLRTRNLDSFFAVRTGANGGAFYALHSKLNHSCDSNASAVSGAFYDSTLDVLATRTVLKGEEICISYVDPKFTVAQRRIFLLRDHLFSCVCAVCSA
eukprot:Plantae.Rhodophyta-Palmaria_palmata.ctg1500.p1 GENE.Plantae.Rhodophyta-Palmaria_palmata.ctg1500~~Plantae.Rhodophyta-Palmaria_palmata.ctg1500.p1  ORF type:complete len:200 (-),score=26.46 Plantae.Rhodophyta-Palmaria_palmata.ctg1500:362-961(-)